MEYLVRFLVEGMSSKPKKGHSTGDQGQKAKKVDSVPRPSSSTVAQKPPKQTKDDAASTAKAIPTTSRFHKNELEIHQTAASHFQDMSLADRFPEQKSCTHPSSPVPSLFEPELTSGIGLKPLSPQIIETI